MFKDPKLPKLEFRTVLVIILTLLLIVGISGYILFQARFLIAGPQIELLEVPDTLQNARKITLSGRAYNITHLWLNDRQIFTNEAGYFKEAVVLENGYTVTTLKAKDRFGRETRVERPFVYTPASISRF